MSEKWDSYISEFDGKIASFFVDLGLKAPIPEKRWSVFVRLGLLDPREDGVTQKEEFEVLLSIEDSVLDIFKGHGLIYAGRMTTDGKRLMVFYSGREFDAKPLLGKALERFPEYKCESWCSEDPEWQFYKGTLYPSPDEMQVIQNGWVLEALQKDGDKLERAREVTHWAYFERKPDRTAFVDAVEALGFKVDCHVSKGWAPQIYCAVLNRVDRVDETSINETVLQLFRLANHHDGEYDGWETSVETDKPIPEPKRPWWKRVFSK